MKGHRVWHLFPCTGGLRLGEEVPPDPVAGKSVSHTCSLSFLPLIVYPGCSREMPQGKNVWLRAWDLGSTLVCDIWDQLPWV